MGIAVCVGNDRFRPDAHFESPFALKLKECRSERALSVRWRSECTSALPRFCDVACLLSRANPVQLSFAVHAVTSSGPMCATVPTAPGLAANLSSRFRRSVQSACREARFGDGHSHVGARQANHETDRTLLSLVEGRIR